MTIVFAEDCTAPWNNGGLSVSGGDVEADGYKLKEHDHDDLTSGGKTGKSNPS